MTLQKKRLFEEVVFFSAGIMFFLLLFGLSGRLRLLDEKMAV